MKTHVPLFNVIILQKCKEKAYYNTLKRKTFKKILNLYKIKSSYHTQILNEMQQNNLIKIIDKQNIEIINFSTDTYLAGIDEVAKMYGEGMTQKQIAKKMGLSQKSVSCLLKT